MVHGGVPVGRLGSGLGRDLGELFLAGCEGGPRLGEDAWNGSRKGEGSRRTVRVAEVMEGGERMAARET